MTDLSQMFSFLIYVVSLLVVLTIVYASLRRSAFGVLLAAHLAWFIVGCHIYPLFNLCNLVEINNDYNSFILHNGQPGILAAIHILLISVGMWVGYIARGKYRHNGVLEQLSTPLKRVNPLTVWRITILSSFAIIVLFYSLVGFESAIANAVALRSDDVSGFGGNEQFLFIKTVSSISGIATAIAPVALLGKDRLFVVLYVIFIALSYLNSTSRNVVLTGLIVPILVFAKLRGISFRTFLIVSALVPLGFLVLLYGKPLGHFISAYLEGRPYELRAYQADAGFLNAILVNLGFQWYSVQAGLVHFFESGLPLFPQDVGLSMLFGMIPSRVLDFVGAGNLYYGNAEVRLATVNTAMFGLNGGTIPPTAYGYSAYLLPLAGGFLVGFVMLRTFAFLEGMWVDRERHDVTKIWIPYVWFLFFAKVFSLIPEAIPSGQLQLIWVFILAGVLALKGRLR